MTFITLYIKVATKRVTDTESAYNSELDCKKYRKNITCYQNREKCMIISNSNLETKLELDYPFKKYLENNRNFYDFSLKSTHF